MLQCPRCLNDELARVPRTHLERVLFVRLFECRMCGFRSFTARRGVAAAIQLLSSRYARFRVPGFRPVSKES
jgi:hypothetical protein